MSSQIFPKLIGETYPVLKEPVHDTNIQKSQSGVEVRIANWAQERYRWTIPYGYLNHDPAVAAADLQIIEGLYNLMHGRWDSFLYSDPTDFSVTGSIFGTGDGTTTQFQLARTRGGASHWIYNVDSTVVTPVVKVNGTPTSVTISASGLVTFGSAPAGGAVLTVDFNYYFRVRFDEDSVELTNECGPYWTIKQVVIFEVAANR